MLALAVVRVDVLHNVDGGGEVILMRYRSAITGRWVSTYYGKRHPRTTVCTRVKRHRR